MAKRRVSCRRLAALIEEIRAVNPPAAEQLDHWIWDLAYGTPEDRAAAVAEMQAHTAEMRQQLGLAKDGRPH